MNLDDPLIDGLEPLTSRVRTDATAVRRGTRPAAWTRDALTRDRMAMHLNGGPARGVCPIKAGESVTMVAVLDLDSHKGEVTWSQMGEVVGRVAGALEVLGMAPILFRSSGGLGVHMVLLWSEPQDAYSVRALLKEMLESVGLTDGTGGVGRRQVEVFPRQDSVDLGKYGNMFVLPLAGRSEPLELGEEELW